jgi:Ca-activated chloride channel family protein
MTIKLRYKQPDDEKSALFSLAIADRLTSSRDLGFAAAVAEFGLALRDSEFKGSATFASAAALAERYKGPDPYGRRGEFIRLIETADRLSRRETTQRQP